MPHSTFAGSGFSNHLNTRERGTLGNNGARNISSSNSATPSDIVSSHQEVIRTSSSSATLVSMNSADTANKYHYQQSLQQQNQKSTGTSSVASDSITGNEK